MLEAQIYALQCSSYTDIEYWNSNTTYDFITACITHFEETIFKSFPGSKLSGRDKTAVKPKVASKSHSSIWRYVSLRPSVQSCHKSIHSTKNTKFIWSVAFILLVVGLSYNNKATTAVYPSNSSLSHWHRVTLNNNLCTKMASSWKLHNLDHVMKVLYSYTSMN